MYTQERKDITKTSSSKSNDEHSPTITSTKETSETRDDGFQGTTFSSKKLTDPSLFSNSDITPDPIITTMSDHNEKHIQSKSGYLFWNIILLTSSCVVIILITVIGWICVRCIIKRRGTGESPMNSISNEEIEMTSVFNEHFQETSFDGGSNYLVPQCCHQREEFSNTSEISAFLVKKVESITDKDTTDGDGSSSLPSHNSVQSGLYSLISIPIFAIIIAILIIFLRKYGCYRCANLVRAVSNYMMDINLGDNISNRTPAEVNEALDNITTEEYGSSPTSSLSWDSRIAVEADRISHIIKDTNISSEISLSPTHINDQGTQTSHRFRFRM